MKQVHGLNIHFLYATRFLSSPLVGVDVVCVFVLSQNLPPCVSSLARFLLWESMPAPPQGKLLACRLLDTCYSYLFSLPTQELVLILSIARKFSTLDDCTRIENLWSSFCWINGVLCATQHRDNKSGTSLPRVHGAWIHHCCFDFDTPFWVQHSGQHKHHIDNSEGSKVTCRALQRRFNCSKSAGECHRS